MSDHVVSVGPVSTGTATPAFAYSCSCGVHGQPRRAYTTGNGRVTGKARNEALEQARTDGLTHQREAAGLRGGPKARTVER